ncbi:MAG: flagellar protein FlaG [Spirochaetota bacterium]
MELEIQGIMKFPPVQENVKHDQRVQNSQPPEAIKTQELQDDREFYTKEDIENYLKKILKSNPNFNRRLKFSVNEELNQVVVKVIDSETDKVIKEIPPAEIQKLQVRIREIIGILFDEKI